jgi:GMP synthase-like glutamine amidotransferase
MNIHYLQHVPFEGLGSIEPELTAKGHHLTNTQLYKNEPFPAVDTIDRLIVMGGPMGVHDENEYPWLKREKQFIKQVIESGKIVLGICLGAQLIAAVLGAKVYKNRYREIGWFNIDRSAAAATTILSSALPEQAEVFHWHGDTFDIPFGAELLVSSDSCKNQGFILDNRVIGLQFHLETTPELARALINNSADELDGSRYVQTEKEMLANPQRFSRINQIMSEVLDALEKRTRT